ncbi:hypothetical protein B0J12DRAFT_705753 [Macrophomina phaseolina]|uniref:Alpha/beta hydrolase fold-3 domain-containing protein n=1 Tax=Macrophomina phaseolina TaxID=35725 RepID=A0ABQ8FRA8_9PEZI|nr:hypothetical protein B0J12DRAFT_705753 [Macrophomina phaseolina]
MNTHINCPPELICRMAKAIPMVLVSVEYRLAPENPWPASLNDCVTVAKWAMNEFALELNLDVTSGLVLSATSSQLLYERHPVRGILAFASLTVTLKAVLEDLRRKYSSMDENADTAILRPDVLYVFLGKQFGGKLVLRILAFSLLSPYQIRRA